MMWVPSSLSLSLSLELPDDEEGLENLDKLLKEAHSAIDKLGAAKQEEQSAIAT